MFEPSAANDDVADPIFGLLDVPGVSWTASGGGDRLAMTLAIRFPDEAIDSLADRFRCAPDAYVIMGEIVDGIRRIYGNEAVTLKTAAKGS